MGLFDWLKKKAAGDHSAELEIDANEDSFEGLSLKQVLDAHMAWRTRLQQVLNGSSKEAIEIGHVAPDDVCTLGKWLHGTGKQQFGKLPEYAALRSTHKHFHLCAGEILMNFNSGNKAKAESLLHGEFRKLSDRVQLDLVRLYAMRH